VAGDWLGVEGSDVLGWGQHKKDEPAPEQQRDAHAANTAPAGHKPIDTDDLDLDELTARLYDRIRSRLRLELLLDRERAGLLSDFR
jgi:hypothetical protein